jgi:hypothetical protein
MISFYYMAIKSLIEWGIIELFQFVLAIFTFFLGILSILIVNWVKRRNVRKNNRDVIIEFTRYVVKETREFVAALNAEAETVEKMIENDQLKPIDEVRKIPIVSFDVIESFSPSEVLSALERHKVSRSDGFLYLRIVDLIKQNYNRWAESGPRGIDIRNRLIGNFNKRVEEFELIVTKMQAAELANGTPSEFWKKLDIAGYEDRFKDRNNFSQWRKKFKTFQKRITESMAASNEVTEERSILLREISYALNAIDDYELHEKRTAKTCENLAEAVEKRVEQLKTILKLDK